MSLDMFPLMEVPFDSYCLLMDVYKSSLVPFVPSKMEEDLALGKINVLVYWYPRLVLKLYDMAYDGEEFREYLDYFNEHNSIFFETIFPSTVKKLDELKEKHVKLNHMDEVHIKNGKIK